MEPGMICRRNDECSLGSASALVSDKKNSDNDLNEISELDSYKEMDLNLTSSMASGECRSSVHDRLLHMMEMSRAVMVDISGLAKFSHVLKVSQHRANAIRWIKDVAALSHVSVESRDTSIQIFDRFLGVCLSENKNILGHSADVALAAAVSILIASKMHETRPLSMSSFPHLRTNDLIQFERLVITKLGYATFPLASPVSFIRYLLSLWADGNDYPYLISTACELVGDFYEAPEAPHFAPSAVALSALLLSFSKLGMDCSDWLEHVPNICLPSPLHPVFNSNFLVSFLDVDNCLSVFQRIQANIALRPANQSSCLTPQTPMPTAQVTERLISPNSVGDLSPPKTEEAVADNNNNNNNNNTSHTADSCNKIIDKSVESNHVVKVPKTLREEDCTDTEMGGLGLGMGCKKMRTNESSALS